jgi:hypothetical protein
MLWGRSLLSPPFLIHHLREGFWIKVGCMEGVYYRRWNDQRTEREIMEGSLKQQCNFVTYAFWFFLARGTWGGEDSILRLISGV